jgi:hypothetical protein
MSYGCYELTVNLTPLKFKNSLLKLILLQKKMDYFAKLNTPQEKWDVYECENCGSVVRTGRLLLHHYSLMHKGSPEFKSKCLFSKNCYHQEYFKSYHALYQHLKQYHDSFF